MCEDEVAAVDATGERMRVLEVHFAAAGEPDVADEDRCGELRVVPESPRHIALVGSARLLGDPCFCGADGREAPAVSVPLGPLPEAAEGEAGRDRLVEGESKQFAHS